jgi:methylisocitrate lyase
MLAMTASIPPAMLRASGSTESRLPDMLTRQELYETLGYAGYEALDVSIVASLPPRC